LPATPFVYRKILGPWALYVELTATAEESADDAASAPHGTRRISDRVSLAVLDQAATPEDVHHLEAGLRRVADAIEAARDGRPVVIRVTALDYMPTDYQPEAAAAAAAGWAAREFGFPPPPIDVTFDRSTGYTLTWPAGS